LTKDNVMDSEKQQLEESIKAGYEKRDVAIGKILAFGFAGVIVIIVAIVFVIDFFDVYTQEVIEDVVYTPESVQLRELRARETEVLTSYKLLDPDKGIYQIPIERAMELIADEAFQNKK